VLNGCRGGALQVGRFPLESLKTTARRAGMWQVKKKSFIGERLESLAPLGAT